LLEKYWIFSLILLKMNFSGVNGDNLEEIIFSQSLLNLFYFGFYRNSKVQWRQLCGKRVGFAHFSKKSRPLFLKLGVWKFCSVPCTHSTIFMSYFHKFLVINFNVKKTSHFSAFWKSAKFFLPTFWKVGKL
jgi:hypothetical protein